MNAKQTTLQVVLIVTGIYVVVAIVLTLAQRKLMYFPARLDAAQAQRVAATRNFAAWQNASDQIIGWKCLYPGKARGKVLIVHGNAGCALDRMSYAQGLQDVEPLDIYILEYPGYGTRAGSPSQKSLFAAGEEAITALERNGPVYLVGESLGTGIAAYLAGKHPQSVAGMFLIAPYNNMTSVAQSHLSLFPVKLMLRDKYPSDSYLASYTGPVAILLAGHDEVIPNKFGRKLFDVYGGPKKLWFYKNATHNDVLFANPAIWNEVIQFWRSSES